MESILQSEAAECGLACLAMVASAHGNNIGLRTLRTNHAVSLKGSTLAQVMDVAAKLGFNCRPLRLDLKHLTELQLPCILHWDLNHFVVLTRVGRRGVTICDPAVGKRTMEIADFSQHFTGIALELSPSADFTRAPPEPSIGIFQLTGRITGLWHSLALILLLSLSLQIFVLTSPFFMQWIVDHVLIAHDFDLLTVLGTGFLLAVILQTATGFMRGWSIIHLSGRLGFQWSGNVFSHLLRLPLDFYEKRHMGDVISRMGSVQAIQRTLTTSFIEAIVDGLMAVVTFAMMLLYSWKLALITLFAVALYLASRVFSFRALRTGTEQQLVAAARQQSHLLESIRGAQSVKVAGREPLRRSGYLNLLNDAVNREVLLARFGLAFSSSNQLIFGIERILVLWIGATLAMESLLSAGMLIAYLSYKDQFALRISGLIDKFVEFRMLRLHCERLADIALTPPEDQQQRGNSRLPSRLRIDVDSLSFRHSQDDPWIIRNLSMHIDHGESVAITGVSGCGKTTLIKLLLGLLKPTEGEIRIGGVPLTKICAAQYRDLVGAVMQDDQLFAGSISDNISFHDDLIDHSRVQSAAEMAAVHSDIVSMPMGYSSLIGDMGTTLSGGQKQRVILARALYRQPKILFLDEATSHLDVGCESMVSESVRKLSMTRVIIAHRPETISSADRVLVMSQGAIVQEIHGASNHQNREMKKGKSE